MKKLPLCAAAGGLMLVAGAFALAGEGGGCACCGTATTRPTTCPAGQHDKYVCPMGCASSDKPAKCPKCGMDMVEKKVDGAGTPSR